MLDLAGRERICPGMQIAGLPEGLRFQIVMTG